MAWLQFPRKVEKNVFDSINNKWHVWFLTRRTVSIQSWAGLSDIVQAVHSARDRIYFISRSRSPGTGHDRITLVSRIGNDRNGFYTPGETSRYRLRVIELSRKPYNNNNNNNNTYARTLLYTHGALCELIYVYTSYKLYNLCVSTHTHTHT